MFDETTEALIHFGKKGMKWGVRKSTVSSDYTSNRSLSKNSAKKLSNDQLKQVISRMNLEKQYKDLKLERATQANKTVLAILALGTTINTVATFKNTPAGIAVVSAVKNIFKK